MIYDSTAYSKLKQYKADCEAVAEGYDSCYVWTGRAQAHLSEADSLVVESKKAQVANRNIWANLTDRRFWYGVGAGALVVLILVR